MMNRLSANSETQLASAGFWRTELQRSKSLCIVGALASVIGLSAWVSLAPIASAVVAEGVIKAQGNRKTIQHAEGGIISQIHIKEGDVVKQGQLLITLSDQRVASNAGNLVLLMIAETVRAKRLDSEIRRLPFSFDDIDLDPLLRLPVIGDGAGIRQIVLAAFQKEQRVFVARDTQLKEQMRWLTAQLQQIKQEQESIALLITASQKASSLAVKELGNNEKLKAEGFVSEGKIIELERALAEYRVRVESAQAQGTQVLQKANDTQLRLSVVQAEYSKIASEELRETTQKITQVEQELRPVLDAQKRQQIVAPVGGQIVDLKINTLGSAIGPREPLLDIVPNDDLLTVEVRVAPQSIQDVQNLFSIDNRKTQSKKHNANVVLTAYNLRNTPQVHGQISSVGADRLTDPATRQPYYVVNVSLSDESLKEASALAGQDLVLKPGMQVEVYLPTQNRTAFRYLLDPLIDGVRRSLRER